VTASSGISWDFVISVTASGGISWDFMIPLTTSPPFLGFYDLAEISEIASPPDASPGIL
jgi:hypothetical protein